MTLCDRQAIQAAIAVLLAGVLAALLQLQHAYWVTITAGVLITPSWGQGLEKAAQRLIGTAFGCLAGLLLAWLMPGSQSEAALALLAFTLAAYHFGSNYTHMMFWLSLFLMLVFSLAGELTVANFLARVYDTLLGAAVATLVSVVVLPTHSRNRFREAAMLYFHDSRDLFHDAFCLGLLDERAPRLPWPKALEGVEQREPAAALADLPGRRHRLIGTFKNLREAHRQSLYEGVFVRFSRRRSQRILEEEQALSRAVTDFVFAVHDGTLLDVAAPYREDFRQIHRHALDAFARVQDAAQGRHRPPVEDGDINALRRQLRERALDRMQRGEIRPEEVLQLVVALDFIWRMLDTIEELIETLEAV